LSAPAASSHGNGKNRYGSKDWIDVTGSNQQSYQRREDDQVGHAPACGIGVGCLSR
jgi:hypothetical protein